MRINFFSHTGQLILSKQVNDMADIEALFQMFIEQFGYIPRTSVEATSDASAYIPASNEANARSL